MIGHVIGFMIHPQKEWQMVATERELTLVGSVIYTAILAVIPAVAWYYGVTDVGWRVGDGDIIRMTPDSAFVLIVLFYLTMVASICAIGYMIHWMSHTYGSDSSTAKGITVAGFSATPLFIAGAIGFMPVFWAALILAIIAICYAVYLLYVGIPIVMGIPEERGFLFSSAVIAFCLVILIIIMTGSVIAWDMGAAPAFTD